VPSTGLPRLTKADALDHVRNFFSLPVEFHELRADEELESVELAVDHGKSYYDMTYIRLAAMLGCKCCIADLRVLGGVGPTFPRHLVTTLSELAAP
jgi:predicted nucleic acid-binding protein